MEQKLAVEQQAEELIELVEVSDEDLAKVVGGPSIINGVDM